jgi:hypothetical protein
MTERVHSLEAGRARRGSWWALTLVALLLYLGLASYQLNLPGLNYDEALDAAPALQAVLGKRIDGAYTVDVAGRQWPLMIEQWFGATTTYLLVAAFGLFGIGATTIRATGVFVGVITLLLIWGFLREYLDERAAGLSVLLLAASPSYVFWSRMIAWVHFPMLPISVVSVWLLFRWYARRQGRYLVLACLGLGLGAQTHIIFLLIWAGLGLGWLVLSPWLGKGRGWRRWLWPWQITGARVWGLALLALLLGAAPLLVYNLRQAGTLQHAGVRFDSGEVGQFRSLGSLIPAAAISFQSVSTLMSGGWFAAQMGALHRNLLALPVLGLALVSIGWLAAGRALSYSLKRVALFALFALSIVILRTLVEGAYGIQHLLIAMPIPQALVAVACFGVADFMRSAGAVSAGGERPPAAPVDRKVRRYGPGALAVVLVGLVGAEIWTSIGYHRTLERTGGAGYFSDAIYALAQDLEQPGTPQSVAMDWGFRRNLQVLTQGRVDPPEWFTYNTPPGPEFEGYLSGLIDRHPEALYLFHSPNYAAFPGHEQMFEDIAYRRHLTPVLWKSYVQRDGKPIYQVYTLTPTPPLFEAPAIQQTLDVRLGDGLALLGYDLPQHRTHPGQEVRLTLYWEATAPQVRDYKVFAHLLDDNGKLWGQHDDFPAYGSHPMTEWEPGEIVPDRIVIELPQDIPPGSYHVFVGMYDPATGERLPLLREGQRLKGDTLGLADIPIESAADGVTTAPASEISR